MKQSILAALLASLVFANQVQAIELTSIQTDRSELSFVYTQMGVPVEGRFKKFTAQLSFDLAKLATAKAVLDLDLASIDAGSPEASDEVAGKDWFNTKTFPRAEFVSTGFKALGGNRYEVSGNISIKGHTQAVVAPFTLDPQGNITIVDGAFVLKRADFSIGEGIWADFGTVANEIQIKFLFLASAGK